MRWRNLTSFSAALFFLLTFSPGLLAPFVRVAFRGLPAFHAPCPQHQADVCKKSFKATSLRLKCAIQRAIASSKVGGDEETAGFLKYVVHPGGDLADRVLPPPLFCTGSFDQDPVSMAYFVGVQ